MTHLAHRPWVPAPCEARVQAIAVAMGGSGTVGSVTATALRYSR